MTVIPERPALERRVLAAIQGAPGLPPRIPVVVGGCGFGRSSLLLRLRDLIGRSACQYIDVEQSATTPERFLAAIKRHSPLALLPQYGSGRALSAREAFDATLALFDTSRASDGSAATFLLDEFLELRTFENFPGLRAVMADLIGALATSGNHFVLTSRYPARTERLMRGAPAVFEVIPVTPLTAAEVRATLPTRAPGAGGARDTDEDHTADELGMMVQALSGGRPAYARLIADMAAEIDARSGDPVSALSALLAQGRALDRRCRFSYELRLHRARGYGALKAILSVLSEEEPLTLTEIAGRLGRTPGSTKDYLSWLEDVDLIIARQKRYSFEDPMLRLWVRLHAHPVPPGDEDLAREVHAFAAARLPHAAPALAMTGPALPARDKYWGIIEID